MDKLFRFSKLAAIITLVSAALFVLCSSIFFFVIYESGDEQELLDAFDRFFGIKTSLQILKLVTIVVFGSLIYKFSANGSPLRTPAVIGIISAVIVMVRYFMAFIPITALISDITIEDVMMYDMMYRNTLVLLSSISIIGFLISFIWLSRYFNERKIKLLCIAYPVLSAVPFLSVTFLPELFVRSFYYDGGYITTDIGMIVIDTVFTPLGMIILSAFYYMFYKMSTK